MLRNKLMAGLAVLALLGTIIGCGGDTGESNEAATTFTLEGYVMVDAYHYDEATGTYIHFYHDESSNLVVNAGLEWIELQLGSDSPTATSAQYISLSTDGTSPVAGWTQIISELTTVPGSGLARALGAYTSAGTGSWTIVKQFTADATFTDVQLSGLQWASSGDNNLLAANTFTAVSLVTDDLLTVTWTISVANL